MEFLLISADKLKITLTDSDLSVFCLTCDTVDYANTETRHAFWSILDRAKHETGFDAAACRVLIQLYPLRHGGCEMYVTRLSGSLRSRTPSAEDDPDTLLISVSAAPPAPLSVCRFTSRDTLFSACDRLSRASYEGNSAVFTVPDMDGGLVYCLLLEPAGIDLSFLQEYGTLSDGTLSDVYLLEHGTPFCRHDAVHTLSRLH